MYEQGTNSVSGRCRDLDFLVAAIFTSFGLFAPRNATVMTALFVAGALSLVQMLNWRCMRLSAD